ncbi:SDR family oxidoreductase [Lederbergia wuyishanensis]|uniref:Short-subunit dehydrogenase n=1 Tax=Lederbergia wuyishanensis TaxID=1347903 RepID=A0ABU0DAI4_9BACI|nr:SDR family oxidoreductase [Lederbergia wuyishanensis]MCJ8009687.1 SDR family oxidoreductase [Lederbergia wuyishanensis]MDQ0345438.1 short-subunit dehydrogenase [Lederbergia wuyishanensis]
MKKSSEQVWFITGANKGIGAAIAKEALNKGYKVVATARKTEGMEKTLGESPNLLITSLDITNEGKVQSSVKAALERFGTIDVLVNNAGYAQLGYFEETSEGLVRQQMETNVFGTMKLTRTILPTMRKQGSGTIIVFSSAMGITSLEGGSVYSASKFALEGWIEGLNMELKGFGIRCMLVEPGPFRTDFVNEQTSAKFSDIEIADYKKQREMMRNFYFSGHQQQSGDPAKLARGLMTVINDSNPPLRLLVGTGLAGFISQYLQNRCSEYEAWREVSDSTNFD